MRLIDGVAGGMIALAFAAGAAHAGAGLAGGVDWNLLNTPNDLGAFTRGFEQGLRIDAQRRAQIEGQTPQRFDAPSVTREYRMAPGLEPRPEPRAEPRSERWPEPVIRPMMARPSAVEERRFGGGL